MVAGGPPGREAAVRMAGAGRTGSEVEGDVLGFARGGALAREARGGLYRGGCRPPDSRAEDIVVAFTAGLPGEVARGVVTLRAFVRDVALAGGQRAPDLGRCAALERAAAAWVDGLSCAACGGYRFRLESTIRTEASPETGEHFVVVKLGYDFYG